jgi:hypothetical protein
VRCEKPLHCGHKSDDRLSCLVGKYGHKGDSSSVIHCDVDKVVATALLTPSPDFTADHSVATSRRNDAQLFDVHVYQLPRVLFDIADWFAG